MASLRWAQVDAVVLSSELVAKESSDGGDTYRVLIRYRYEWPPAGQVEAEAAVIGEAPLHARGRKSIHESERYDFSTGSTNVGVSGMHEIVAAHPPGARVVCHVDPDDPASAVIDRGLPLGVWFGAAFSAFPVGGFFVIYVAWRARRGAGEQAAAARNGPDLVPVGEVALKPAEGRWGAFFALMGVSVFWNGIVSVFVVIAAKEFGEGFIGWFLPVFLLPFVAIGLLMLAGAVQAFSRLFAPPVEVRLDPSLLRLGSRVPFSWRLGGHGVRSLTIELVGREEATYRQGTNTSTDKSDFFRAVIFSSTDRLSLLAGRAEMVLPVESAAPSFVEAHNRIVWELEVAGEIPWRADVNDRFVLGVRSPVSMARPVEAVEPRPVQGGGFTLWTVARFTPGEALVFSLGRDASAKREPAVVQLGWFTEGKGTRDSAIVWKETLPDFAPGTDRGFEVSLPCEPWSFSGKLVAVEWRLEVVDAQSNTLLALPLVVAPGGVAVPLSALPARKGAWEAKFGWMRGQRSSG